MSEAAQAAAAAPDTGPTIEEVARQVFGEAAPAAVEPEPKEPTQEAEPPKEEPPKLDPKVAARLVAARRAEERASAARAEIAKARQEIDAQRAEIAEQLKVAEQLKAAKRSPSRALELLGMTPKEFLETLATEHEPAAVAARAVEGLSPELEALKQEIAALKAAAAEREQAAKRHEVDATFEAATKQFIASVDAAPEKYPHLIAEMTPEEMAAAAQDAASRHGEAYRAKFGKYPDDDIIAEYLEDQARARAEALAERRARVGQKAQMPSRGGPSGDSQATQPATGPSPRTLTSRTASEKATAARPWSQEWADEESLRILNAALKTG